MYSQVFGRLIDAGLIDFGEIQEMVDDIQECLSTGLHRLDHIALHQIQWRVTQELRASKYAMKGTSQLVGDTADKGCMLVVCSLDIQPMDLSHEIIAKGLEEKEIRRYIENALGHACPCDDTRKPS